MINKTIQNGGAFFPPTERRLLKAVEALQQLSSIFKMIEMQNDLLNIE